VSNPVPRSKALVLMESNSYLYLIHSEHRPMRGRSSTNSSSISSPLRSLSNTGSPRTTTPANAPTPVSPGIAGFSTITVDRARHNGVPPGASDSSGDSQPQQMSNGPATDLNQEVAALSNKLIKAINHQAMLDDSLTSTKHELELSKVRIKQLEAVARDHEQMMAKGLLVDRKDMETEAEQFMRRIRAERDQRSKAERDKQTIEKELEHLTTALFEEANKVGTCERKVRWAVLISWVDGRCGTKRARYDGSKERATENTTFGY